MFHQKDIDALKAYLQTVSKESKIYLGCDSVAFKKTNKKTGKSERWATYYLVVVIHKNNKNGCKIFHTQVTERDYSDSPKRPSFRIMNEVTKVAELYTALYDLIHDRDVEVHLDIATDSKYASNSVAGQALGYIQSVTGTAPKLKPEAWAATAVADKAGRGGYYMNTTFEH